MVDNFEMAESKYGRIFKVAGPRKYSPVFAWVEVHITSRADRQSFFGMSLTNFLCIFSRRGREYVRLKNVRAGQGRLGQARR